MPRRSATVDLVAVLAALPGRIAASAAEPLAGTDDPASDAMLDAAGDLLGRFGLKRWSMDDVAEAAGVGRATVYRRFATREDLVQATVTRDVSRFFAAVTEAVASVPTVEEKVVEGFLIGMRMARESVVPGLLVGDRDTALSVFTTAPVLSAARAALLARYQALSRRALSAAERADVELVAEVLVRLAVSFVLIPDSVIDFGDEALARRSLRRIVRPLIENGFSRA